MKRTRVHDSRARESSRIELTGVERKDDDARRVVRDENRGSNGGDGGGSGA